MAVGVVHKDGGKLDTDNVYFQRAVAFVAETNENIFLTGKAGTGKTTFLKYIREHLKKQCAVVAPTGVAAINAGGETIHSFLQLPFAPFVPGSKGGFCGASTGAEDKHSLLANLRLRDTKLKLIRKLDLMIIDEVSMVRCDLMDEIDLVLRHVRKNNAPFGGVQMVFIGDLYQLPPVTTQEDWQILGGFYRSPYFFDAHVLQQQPPLYLELKKIYRQKDQTFIDILNRVRNGQVMQQDVDLLNQRYDPELQKEDGYIILSTHNNIADDVNRKALEDLPSQSHNFKGEIKNDFSTKSLPTEEVLQLKAGAQVMFIKNDVQTPRRYYNGKIGKVSSINPEGVWISFPNETDEIRLELETWKNMRYVLNQQTGQIEEEETGSFTQYPVRLAWAITVHKSQGLTLQKAVVDLSQSFAPGQVYVALSRCTSLEGLVLRSRMSRENVIVDVRVAAFAETEQDDAALEERLVAGKRYAQAMKLCYAFSFGELLSLLDQSHMELLKRKTGPREQNVKTITQLHEIVTEADKTAQNFQKLVRNLAREQDDVKMRERALAAQKYFADKMTTPCLKLVDDHFIVLNTFPKVAKITKVWKDVHNMLKQKSTELQGLDSLV